MKDKTKVKKKNVGKVAAVKIRDPNATMQEIEKETGLAYNTVLKATRELSKTGVKDPTIAYIVGSSKENLKDIAILNRWKVREMMNKVVDKVDKEGNVYIKKDATISLDDMKLIQTMSKEEMARVTVLGGSITDKDGGLKEFLTEDQMKTIASRNMRTDDGHIE